MKKIVTSLFVFAVVSISLFADGRYITEAALPAKAKSFLSANFSGVAVVFAEQEWDSYEVNLANGVEIEFTNAGDWKSVDAKYQPLPTGFIPEVVLNAVKGVAPQAAIVKIEKAWNGFEVELNNRMDLKITSNGQVMEMEYDD